jgi:exonuclease SbcC
MKNYPYIYTLTTVGLINHYNSDYLFNTMRTDFAGDSGSGKSMIADLLQLIFVGAGEFEAATDVIKEPRTPSGMVVNMKSKGYAGKGYALLNIAISKGKYLVIGIYLENSTNHTKLFVIHSGYDLDSPVENNRPILSKDFLNEDQILPIEDSVKYLRVLGFNCETLSRAKYHKFLYSQNILALDLSDNPQKLRTYALIIRSFSRGKGFKFDSEPLQEFLFGNEVEKQIREQYKAGIENIKGALEESGFFMTQIEKLKEKRTALENLAALEKEKIEVREKYLWRKLFNHTKAQEGIGKQLKTNTTAVSIAEIQYFNIEKASREQDQKTTKDNLQKIRTAQELVAKFVEIEAKGKAADQRNLEAQEALKKAETIKGILVNFDGSIIALKNHYSQQQVILKEKKQIQDFRDALLERGILDKFEASEFAVDYLETKKKTSEKISQLAQEIEVLKGLMKFSNVENESSFAYWAIRREKEFTPDEESVLLRLQDLIVSEPAKLDKTYLSDPERLLSNISKYKVDADKSFWIELGGTVTYIPLIRTQYLSSPDPQIRREYFGKQHRKASESLRSKEQEKQNLSELIEALESIPGLQGALKCYERREEVNSFAVVKALNLDSEQFEENVQLFQNYTSVALEAKQAKGEYSRLIAQYTTGREQQKFLKSIPNIELRTSELSTKLETISEKIIEVQRGKRRYSALLSEPQIDMIDAEVLNAIESGSSLGELMPSAAQKQASLRVERKRLKSELSATKKAVEELEEEFRRNQLQWPEDADQIETQDSNYWIVYEQFQEIESKYNTECSQFVSLFLKQDEHKYADTRNWKVLARAALPDIFKSQEFEDDALSSEIEKHLQQIVEKNSVIGDRKVQILMAVFDEVEKAYGNFAEEVTKLRRFFNGNDKRITGGYKVALTLNASNIYPIEWITNFKKQMRQASTDRSAGLFKVVDQGIEFKEIIQNAFKECGGKKKDPEINALLNPKSYFELKFKLERDGNASGGSTGQVYSAIALLCIARLSLIEDKNKGKEKHGVRFMPIDEAAGLGTNYDMLSKIAKEEKFQVVTMSIEPVGEFEKGEHIIYTLNEPEDKELKINAPAFGQFTEEGIVDNLEEYIYNYEE